MRRLFQRWSTPWVIRTGGCEMAAKVTARHLVGGGGVFEAVGALCDDPVPRVARAAQRAVRCLVTAGE